MIKKYIRPPIYHVWASMLRRCRNTNAPDYKYYGGRGITVTEKWTDYKAFAKDMLPSYEKGLSLDRIDNNKGYSKLNCRWATHTEQSRNRRSNHLLLNPDTKEQKTILEWAEIYSIPRTTINSRLRLGRKSFYELISNNRLNYRHLK